MAKLHVVTTFQYKGKVVRCGELPENATLTVSESELATETAKGKHKKTGNWLSPLLNHCLPADKEAREIMGAEDQPIDAAGKDESEEEIDLLRAGFDKIGAAYDLRWKTKRLKDELIKARKEKGE